MRNRFSVTNIILFCAFGCTASLGGKSSQLARNKAAKPVSLFRISGGECTKEQKIRTTVLQTQCFVPFSKVLESRFLAKYNPHLLFFLIFFQKLPFVSISAIPLRSRLAGYSEKIDFHCRIFLRRKHPKRFVLSASIHDIILPPFRVPLSSIFLFFSNCAQSLEFSRFSDLSDASREIRSETPKKFRILSGYFMGSPRPASPGGCQKYLKASESLYLYRFQVFLPCSQCSGFSARCSFLPFRRVRADPIRSAERFFFLPRILF